jgi:hypothetical protein
MEEKEEKKKKKKKEKWEWKVEDCYANTPRSKRVKTLQVTR